MVKYIFLAAFIVLMIGVGIYSRSKVKDLNDFFLGGRKMGPWLTAFSYGTAYFSSVIFIGYAGNIGWGFGISAVWIGVGNALLGCLLAWIVLGPRTRLMTHHMEAETMPDFFQKRYDCRWMKIVTALIIFIFLVPYSASVYKGLSYLFEITFGIPGIYCLVGIAVLTGVYLLLGGYVATALNNLIQGIIMLFGVVLMLAFVLGAPQVGGLSEGIRKLAEIPDAGKGLTSVFSAMPLSLLGLVFLTSFGAWGLPQMIHKFYTIRDKKAIKRGAIVSTVFALVIGGGAYLTGAFGRLFLDNQMPAGGPDTIIPAVLQTALPEALLGLIIVLVLSASMSTLSSLVLVSSSSIAMDLFKGVIFPKMEKKTVMMWMRLLCVVFVGVSFWVAATNVHVIVTLMSLSWGVVAGCFLAPYLYGLYWKGTTKAGAWAGIVSGLLTVLAAIVIKGGLSNVSMPNVGSLAMLVSVAVVPLVSFVTPKYEKAFTDQLFSYER